ncbi:putative calcium-binding protein [Xenococcus sp. PCC 7305]|uniref:calcium-binding protein n=1 Tax=Xenococcus sp. PCC 7305 TaxID=102125 RepID=UPI0002AC5675|nr:calcium-binding protein [Xenococcus sp. PCC 7305]ELS00411.1 putative calcium-binding protein [Xenococcus sp. PCC 7305]
MSITLSGGYYNDYLHGTHGHDWLDGREGNDTLFGYGGNDDLFGWSGNDDLYGDSGDDLLYGENGHDYLVGGYGHDTLSGGYGSDTLIGSDPDFFDSGYGEYDVLSGGYGADKFVLGDSYEAYYEGAGYATITDFNWNEGDKIQVHGSAHDYTLTPWGNGIDINYHGDVIGHVENTTNVIISQDFIFV